MVKDNNYSQILEVIKNSKDDRKFDDKDMSKAIENLMKVVVQIEEQQPDVKDSVTSELKLYFERKENNLDVKLEKIYAQEKVSQIEKLLEKV